MDIFVTGLGIVSGIGLDTASNYEALRAGRHGMSAPVQFRTALPVPVSEVKCSDAELRDCLQLPVGIRASRTALLGMMAASEAYADAQLHSDVARIGLISSTSVGGMDRSEDFYEAYRENPGNGRLRYIATHDCADSTLHIARRLHIDGYTTTLSTACSSAGNAIMLGARLIRCGMLDTVIAGGTDSLCRFTLNGFNSLMIVDKELCRPYDQSRAGLNLGEGAGYIVLQNEKALRRQPYALLKGWANANEAFHQTGSSPEGDGPLLAMQEALQTAGLSPSEVDYINVHGTGTPNNDLSEGRALQRLFGNGNVPAFSSVKGFIGHTLGASEGIEAAYSVLSVARGAMYPNLRFNQPVAETGLIPVTAFSEGNRLRNVLSNSFGFGGNDSSLVFSRID